MVKHTQTISRQQQANCLSVFDHFVGLGLKGLNKEEFDIRDKRINYVMCTMIIASNSWS